MLEMFAQNSNLNGFEPWAQLAATSVIICLFVWMITKQWPAMLAENRIENAQARAHFEKILEKVEDNRKQAAKDGHDAARAISTSLDRQAEAIDNNSRAVYELTHVIQKANT